jgi:hypothetical protein
MLDNCLKEGITMVSNCANPGCGKPLHYLREGRIYVFDASIATARRNEKRQRHLEHYWLCGTCSTSLVLSQDAQGWVRILPKPAAIQDTNDDLSSLPAWLAS